MISVREISKSFGPIRAVDRVRFELARGQIAGLLGPNGAGKTTTIRMITGSLAPDRGSIAIDSHDIRAHPALAKGSIGYLPEHAPVYPEMSVRGTLEHRARLQGVPKGGIRAAVDRVVGLCGLGDVTRRRAGHLSKGFKQRVGLAGALVHDPPVLILDEPTSGLDPGQVRAVRGLIRELARDKTMLICSHILPEIEKICDRVMIMHGGTIRADGAPGALAATAPAPRTYAVELRLNPSAAPGLGLRVLRSIAGVEHARPAPQQPSDAAQGWSRFEIDAAPDAPDLREPIAGAAWDQGLFVRELSRSRATLESYFLGLLDDAPASDRVAESDRGARGASP